MPAPATTNNLLEFIQKSGLHEKRKLEQYLDGVPGAEELTPADLAAQMVKDGMLTEFQAKHLLKGRYRNFFIGKFKVLEPLGAGGMSQVYLCEHAVMKHRVAMKLLPVRESEDRTAVSRFMREARAAAAVNHPNVVRAHDFDLAEKKFYYLIMDFVDGINLHDLIKKLGPLSADVAAHYVLQAAHGLQHILDCGLIHRDLKPSNLLLDRTGTIRILDLGLARFTNDDKDNLTRQLQGKSILGTADFLAPEQAIQADNIDIRADIYSLGATLYFLLSGRAPFESQSVTQKLLAHQIREPDALVGVPEGLAEICKRMMAKKVEDRYQSPGEVIDALAAWTTESLPPPQEEWFTMRAGGVQLGSGGVGGSNGTSTKPPPSTTALSSSGQNTPVRLPAPSRAAPSSAVRRGPPPSSRGGSPSPSSRGGVSAGVSEFDPLAEGEVPHAKSKAGLIAAIAVAAVVLVGGGIAGALYFGGDKDRAQGPAGDGGGGSPAKAAPAPSTVPTPPGALVVGPAGSATLAEALARAKPGDRILVTAGKLDEAAVFNNAAKGVTIEAWPVGRVVPWTVPANHVSGKPLVQISNVDGFRLKGFDFDGRQQADVILGVVGVCPGLSLESLTVRGFRLAGVEFAGASGVADRPIRLDAIRFLGNHSQGAGVRVTRPNSGDPATRHVSVTNGRFEGTTDKLGAGVKVSAPFEDVEFRENRFYQLTRGLHYAAAKGEPVPLTLTVANNCFFGLDTGFGFDAVPPSGSNLNITNNLFMKASSLAATANVNGRPLCAVPDWVCHDADLKRKDGKPTGNTSIDAGTRFYRKTFDVAAVPRETLALDVGAVSSFKVWLNGEPLGESRYTYFDKRVYAFPVAGKLKAGKNVLAVEVRHFLDPLNPSFGSASGVMARIGTEDADDVVVVKTDGTWKSFAKAGAGWERPEFDDTAWAPVHVWPSTTPPVWPWLGSVWDSAVKAKLAGTVPLPITSAGNFRDYDSNEGYPLLGTARGLVDNKVFPQDPDDDANFLRIPRGHKLNTAGPDGTRVGVAAKE
jgi:serine/threonine protein kinase